jgi:1-deoxy-D-xylulose-5-phosphate reductoisomerase
MIAEKIKGVCILGSTGSIGTAALRVLQRQQNRFSVRGLTAFSNEEELARQVEQFRPEFVGIVKNGAGAHASWRHGEECLIEAATLSGADIVLNAVVGAAGLDATLAALSAGKRVALANKETLVVAGDLVLDTMRRGGGELVPVDSEHSAILQCVSSRPSTQIRRLIITASGGPFRSTGTAELGAVTPEDALRHPTWRMGKKITVDSATLVNKALEVIEAHHLFGVPYDNIEVVVHPQSVIHSFVEFVDGSVMAQLGFPTMELPILYALTHPERVADTGVPMFDPVAASPLTFEPVREEDFPALGLGIAAGRRGGLAPAVFNAANEAAVALFLSRRIAFREIAAAIESALSTLGTGGSVSRESLLHADAESRSHVAQMFK